jgi:hypothetical protein
LLHHWQTESNEFFAMAGETCDTEAASQSSGMPKEAVCIESMVSPFFNLTLNGFIYLVLLWQGASIKKKFLVQPDFNMAVS